MLRKFTQEALRSSISSIKSPTDCGEKDFWHDGVTAAPMCLQGLTTGVSRDRDLYLTISYKKKGRRGRHLGQAPGRTAKTVHNQNAHACYIYT